MRKPRARAPLDAALAAGTAWSKLVQMGSETAVASARTIAHRTSMIAEAASGSAAVDHPEIALMSQEKIDAAVEAGSAMMRRLPAMQEMLATWAWNQALRATGAVLDAATSGSLAALGEVQARFLQSSVAASVEASARLARDSVRMARTGLHPVHRAASANAQRLASRCRAP